MYGVRKRLTRDQVLTIPNAMSAFRIALIPFIIWAYYSEKHKTAVLLVVLSALTDIFDGTVARKFNMVSDLGKVLDPVADKLTHAALIICAMVEYHPVLFLLILLAVKESTMLVLGGICFKRRDAVHGAKWYGKLCTVVFESTMIVLMLIPGIPHNVVMALVALCTAVMLFSLLMYTIFFLRHIGKKTDAEGEG